ncbi:MAG: DUF488 family protein [Thermoflavifilum sp.]|nr:DUF488 family protein [Thermoflavifilum sp.]MCL6514880.1 DUF488 family protein [Alicyclobacillus sp.]
MIRVARVYTPAQPEDGARVLCDRLWPRGLRKEQARIDAWFREVAPSPALRTWFGHRPERFDEFRIRYLEELSAGIQAEALADLTRYIDQHNPVTLLYAAKDPLHNHVRVLLEALAPEQRWPERAVQWCADVH